MNTPIENVELPDLSFETKPSSKNMILATFFPKKQKYWCIDFSDCTFQNSPFSLFADFIAAFSQQKATLIRGCLRLNSLITEKFVEALKIYIATRCFGHTY